MEKIRDFTDLYAWQKGHDLVLTVYRLTKNFPEHEKYGLTNQLRRSGISITSNLAEGFGRKSLKEKIQFYSIAVGSLYEFQNQIIIARDLRYVSVNEYDQLRGLTIDVQHLTNALIGSLSRA